MEVEKAHHVPPQKPVAQVFTVIKTVDGEEGSEVHGFVNKVPQLELQDALEKVTLPSDGPVVVADLGSSSGPYTIDNVALIVERLRFRLPKDAEFQAYFNDLPSNNFNNLFQMLTNDVRAKNFFAAGAPGSFYDRLFAGSVVHVFHSSLCLHWLSEIPNAVLAKDSPAYNKGNVWTIHSRSAVAKAYQQQASLDLKKFLNVRAKELAPGGLLFFTLPGRLSSEPNEPTNDSWDEFTSNFNETWSDLVGKGFITEEQLDNFNLPFYMRSIEDVKEAIASCGSLFGVLTTKLHTFDTAPHDAYETVISEPKDLSRNMGFVYKAVLNGLVEAHVGKEAAELIWQRYLELLEKRVKMGKPTHAVCIVALIRK